MARFITRIELHSANWTDYEVLHAAMERLGFKRSIIGDNGICYDLPDAMYYGEAQLTAGEIRDIAATAAASTGKGYGVLTTEAHSTAWIGLPVCTK